MSTADNTMEIIMTADVPGGGFFEVSVSISNELLTGPSDALSFLGEMTDRMGSALQSKVKKGLDQPATANASPPGPVGANYNMAAMVRDLGSVGLEDQ